MIRLIVLLFWIGEVLMLNFLFNESVTSTLEVPSEVEAGNSFTVKITLNKGSIQGFSRFQQALPAGLTAKPLATSNGEFRHQDKMVKLMWLTLPLSETFSVSYSVQIDQRLKGTFDLGGTFSYIENNERKTIQISPSTIKINPNPNIDPKLTVDINDFEKMVIPDLTKKEDSRVVCVRQTPVVGKEGIVVNVLVHKKDRGKFAKIEELVPSGYTAENINSQSGIFIFKNQVVKYLWMNLPPEDYFVVSYRLKPQPDKKLKLLKIDGTFSYIEENETKSISIIQRKADLTDLSQENIDKILASIDQPDNQDNSLVVDNTTKDDVVPDVIDNKDNKLPDNKDNKLPDNKDNKLPDNKDNKQQEQVKKDSTVLPDNKDNMLPDNKDNKDNQKDNSNLRDKIKPHNKDKTYVLQPDSGVYFRVQVAAGHKPVNINRYFKKYNLSLEVKREEHEGWYKYSVGSFRVYKDARDYRVNLWNARMPIDDAFVAAYNEGDRITVQEALMIANQQWYK